MKKIYELGWLYTDQLRKAYHSDWRVYENEECVYLIRNYITEVRSDIYHILILEKNEIEQFKQSLDSIRLMSLLKQDPVFEMPSLRIELELHNDILSQYNFCSKRALDMNIDEMDSNPSKMYNFYVDIDEFDEVLKGVEECMTGIKIA